MAIDFHYTNDDFILEDRTLVEKKALQETNPEGLFCYFLCLNRLAAMELGSLSPLL